MITYSEFLEKVKEFEGLRLNSYKCPSGVLTIGYGHTNGVVAGMSIPPSFADFLLQVDIKIVYYQLLSLFPELNYGGVNRNLTDALIDFIFNIGFKNFKKTTLYSILKSIDLSKPLSSIAIDLISTQLLRWNRSNGKVLKSLETRRKWEVSLLSM